MIVSAMLESPSPKGRVPHQEGVFAAARQYGRPRHPPLSDETGGFELPGPFLPSNNTVESGSKGPRNPRPRALAHTDPRELKHRSLGTSRHSQHHPTPKDRHRLDLEHTSQYFFPAPRTIATPVHRRQRSPASWLQPTHAQPALVTGVVNHGCTGAQRRGSLVPLGDHVLVFARLRNCARGARPRMSDDADLAVLAPSLLASWKLRFRTSRRLGSSAFLFCFNITKPRPDDEGESLSRSRLASAKIHTGLEPVPVGKSRGGLRTCCNCTVGYGAPGCFCTPQRCGTWPISSKGCKNTTGIGEIGPLPPSREDTHHQLG
jgi:hypothetical protein